MNESIIPSRQATFRAATKGMRAYTIARRLKYLRPSMDYRGCSKRQLCDEFTSGTLSSFSGAQLRSVMTMGTGVCGNLNAHLRERAMLTDSELKRRTTWNGNPLLNDIGGMARELLALRAAIPDLVEACREALAYIERDEVTHGRAFSAGEMLRAAIAKAEGRS